MKDINDSIINTILNEGKWDIANIPVAKDDYLEDLYNKLDEELTQEINRLDESVTDDDIIEQLVEALEDIADRSEVEDISEEELVYFNVVNDRLDEIFGGRVKNLLTGKGFKSDKAVEHEKRMKSDPLYARRRGGAEAMKTAAKGLASRKRQALGRLKRKKLLTGPQTGEAAKRVTQSLGGMMQGKEPAKPRTNAQKLARVKMTARNSRMVPVGSVPQVPAVRATTARKKAGAGKDAIESKPETQATTPAEGRSAGGRRRSAGGRRRRAVTNPENAGGSEPVRDPGAEAQAGKGPTKDPKAPKAPAAKGGGGKKSDACHTCGRPFEAKEATNDSYQHDHEEHGTMSIAESIINNVRNRLL